MNLSVESGRKKIIYHADEFEDEDGNKSNEAINLVNSDLDEVDFVKELERNKTTSSINMMNNVNPPPFPVNKKKKNAPSSSEKPKKTNDLSNLSAILKTTTSVANSLETTFVTGIKNFESINSNKEEFNFNVSDLKNLFEYALEKLNVQFLIFTISDVANSIELNLSKPEQVLKAFEDAGFVEQSNEKELANLMKILAKHFIQSKNEIEFAEKISKVITLNARNNLLFSSFFYELFVNQKK
jgi:hypothetical protein